MTGGVRELLSGNANATAMVLLPTTPFSVACASSREGATENMRDVLAGAIVVLLGAIMSGIVDSTFRFHSAFADLKWLLIDSQGL